MFPVVSSLAALVVVVVFAVPSLVVFMDDSATTSVVGYVLLFLFYLAMSFVVIFANTALVGAVMIRLRGDNPTLRDGFGVARSRLRSVFGYALIAATVGVALHILSARGKRATGVNVSGLVSSLLGAAWSIATYLVVPVLVVENVGPIDAIKRSVALLKKTWGEQLAGNIGMGLVFNLLSFVCILLGAAGIAAAMAIESIPLAVGVGVLAVVALAALALLSSTLSGIYVATVYRFAATGDVGSQFSAEMVENTFSPA